MNKKICFFILLGLAFCGAMPAEDHFSTESSSEETLIPKTYLTTPQIDPALESTLVKTIVAIEHDGWDLRLSDGSVYRVAFYFGKREVIKLWEVGDRVVLSFEDRFNQITARNEAVHNLSKGLSVYLEGRAVGLKPNAPDVVRIKKIDFEAAQIFTDRGTVLTVDHSLSPYLKEFFEGDILEFFLPQEGVLDGTKVVVCNAIAYPYWVFEATQEVAHEQFPQ